MASPIREIKGHLAHRRPFRGNSLWATTTVSPTQGTGRLEGEDLARYRADEATITYLVVSYLTPIAWVAEGGVYVVDASFSQTTARHLGVVRGYLR